VARCPYGHQNPEGTKFCRECGAAIVATPPPVTSRLPPSPTLPPAPRDNVAEASGQAPASPDRPRPQIGTPPPPGGRRKPLVIAVGAVITVAVAVTAGYLLAGRNSQPSTIAEPVTTSQTAASVAEAALQGLLLSPDQINAAVRATGMTVTKTETTMHVPGNMSDEACVPLVSEAQDAAYYGSGWSAVRGQDLREPGDQWTHDIAQAVVLFSSAHDAEAFFTASAQRWPVCANRQYTQTVPGTPAAVWTVGPVSNTNGNLSATQTEEGSNGWTCQRALTVANNFAIDVTACSRSA
jgi:hypothetical protein